MPRPSRHAVLGDGPACVHLITRFHNGEFLLKETSLKKTLQSLILNNKKRFHIRIYHYCLMDSHLHLIAHCESTDELSKFMHGVFFPLAQRINKQYKRKGHVFLDRPRTPVIQDGQYLLTTMRYLDMNPVRAEMVKKAHHYSWSSHRHYAFGEADPLIDDAPDYLGLSKVAAIRRKIYQDLVRTLARKGSQRIPELTVWTFVGDRDWVLMKLQKGGFIQRRKPPG
jgi:putative transposase